MSYGASLLTSYPLSYDLSTLASDDLVQRSSFGTFYEPSLPYTSVGSHLLSDDLTYNQLNLGSSSYRSSVYSHFPVTNYRTSSITDWRRDIPPQSTYNPLNNIREYSESLDTSSNTNRESSVARSINDNNLNGPLSIYPNYQQTYNRSNNDINRSPRINTIWSPLRSKIQTNDEKSVSTHRSVGEYSNTLVRKTSPIESIKKDRTPVPSAPTPLSTLTKQDNTNQTHPSSTDTEKQESSINIHTSSHEKKDETSTDEKIGEQAWTKKIDKLHIIKAQREKEKEKAKTSRTLPVTQKKIDNKQIAHKSTTSHDNSAHEVSFQMRSGTYFDSLFDGNFFRKTSTNQQNQTSPYHRTIAGRNKSLSNSFNKPKTTIFLPKYSPPKKAPQYEPPTISATSTNTSTTKKQQVPKQNSNDSFTPRENIHKDTDERYREALTKFRSDRAEQQQKETNESTAKRLTYGDYVRRLTKDDLLYNAVKPSPWSDFIDLKKGHLLSLTKEEKKELYNQSKSYGERIRFRNFTMHYGPKLTQTQYRTHFWPTSNRESQSSDESNDENEDHESKSAKRSNSSSTVKSTGRTFTKPPVTTTDNTTDNQSSHTQALTDQSSTIQASDEDDEYTSDFESSRKQKRNTRFKKPNPSFRTTSGTEETENDEGSEHPSSQSKTHDTDDELFTVMEDKPLESEENLRYKKR